MEKKYKVEVLNSEEIPIHENKTEMAQRPKESISDTDRHLTEHSGVDGSSFLQLQKQESSRQKAGAPDSAHLFLSPQQEEFEPDSFIEEKIKEMPIKRMPTPVIEVPEEEDVNKKMEDIGELINMNPLEIMEEEHKDQELKGEKNVCFKIKYAFTAIRYYIQSSCFELIQHPLFEAVSLLVILANCVVLSLDDPTNDTQDDWQIQADYVFQGLYTLEILLKVLGLGFVLNEGAYIRDPWNILDFVIVVFGYLSYLNISGGMDLKALRTFRVLRPLRTISTVEGLKILMSALVTSLPLLMDTIVILVFFFLIFAIAGVQLWNGLLLYRCVNIETGEVNTDVICGYDKCETGFSCISYISNPNYGGTNFDDVFSAFLTVFQCVTMEGWTDTQYILSKAFGPYSVIFFTPLVMIGAFFLVNFTLAVIKSRVSKLYEENRKMKEQARLNMLANPDEMRRLAEKKFSMVNAVTRAKDTKIIEKKYAGKFFNKFMKKKIQRKEMDQKKRIMTLYNFINTEDEDDIENWGKKAIPTLTISPRHPIHEEIINEVDEGPLDNSSFSDAEGISEEKLAKKVSNRVVDNFKKSLIIQGIKKKSSIPTTGISDIGINLIEVKNSDKKISLCGMAGMVKKPIPKQIQVDFIKSNMISDLDDFTTNFFEQYPAAYLAPSPTDRTKRRKSEMSCSFPDLEESHCPSISREATPINNPISERRWEEDASPCFPSDNPGIRAQSSLADSDKRPFIRIGSIAREENTIITNTSNSPTSTLDAFSKVKVKNLIPKINLNPIDHEKRREDIVRRMSSKGESSPKIFSKRDPLENFRSSQRSPGIEDHKEEEDPENVAGIIHKFVLKKVGIISSSLEDVKQFKKPVASLKNVQTIVVQRPPYKIKVLYTPTVMPAEEEDPEEGKANTESQSIKKNEKDEKDSVFAGTVSLTQKRGSVGSSKSKKGKSKSKKKKSAKKKKVESNKFLAVSNVDSLKESDRSSGFPKASENGSVTESKMSSKKQAQETQQQAPEVELNIQDQIANNLKEDASKNKLELMYSGQEAIPESDPYLAVYTTSYLNSIRVWKHGFNGKFASVRYLFKLIASSGILENFMNLLVLINTITLAMDRYNQPEDEENSLSTLNIVFTAIFIAEMAMKLFGLGIVGYLSDTFNYLDGAVVIFSIVEIIFLDGSGAMSAFRTLRVFRTVRMIRTFRVLRVARLLRSLRSMQTIIEVIGKTIGSFAYIGLLLLIFIFIYALFGMQLYGGQFDFPDGKPRQNFDSFNNAFLSVFQVLTMENWHTILYSCMRAVYSPLAAVYMITWIFIGNYILLNLFLAIMLDAFTEVDEQMDKDSGEEEENESSQPAEKKSDNLPSMITSRASAKSVPRSKSQFSQKTIKQNAFMEDDDEENADQKSEETLYKGVECNYSLYLFHKSNIFRKFNWIIVTSTAFEGVILTLICIGALKLSIDTYFDEEEGSVYETVSYAIDIFLAIAFAIEALMKAIGYGFLLEKGSYLRDSWNQLDFFIVVATIIDISVSTIDIPMVKVLRMFRTFRPLRFVTHNVNMRIIVTALFQSLGAIFNTLIVVWVIWLMFSIVGVNFFAGKFQYCTEDIYVNSNSAKCIANGGEWRTYDHNFDNVINGMLFLFIMTTQENWNQLVLQATDCTDEGEGPAEGNSWYYSYYFIFFLLVGSMFLLNLFVGVMFLNFTKVQKKEQSTFGDILITEEQLNWIEVQKMIIRAEPNYNARTVPPNNSWRKPIHALVTNIIFEIFIAVIILLNMVQLAMLYYDASEEYLLGLDIINYIFTGIFTVEIILKLIGFGGSFWYDAWNVFDFIIVVCSYVDIIFSNLNSSSLTMIRVGPQLIRVLRVLRVSRLLRLIKKYKRLQDIMEIIQLCLPSMMNVFSLLLLILFIYAVLGCYLFENVTTGDGINNFYNFHNFGYAMILCFKIATGEDWNTFMFDCARTTTSCAAGVGCGNSIAYIYFITFKLVVTFIMLNLFILIVLQLFEKFFIESDNIVSKFKEDFEEFQQQWQSLAPSHNGFFISKDKLLRFFRKIPEPLGMEGMDSEKMSVEIMLMKIKLNDEGNIFFNELLYKTMRRIYLSYILMNDFIKNKEKQTCKQIKLQSERATHLSHYEKTRKNIISTATPFVSLMSMRITLKVWKKYLKQHQERVIEQEKKGVLNYESSVEDESPQSNQLVIGENELISPSSKTKVHPDQDIEALSADRQNPPLSGTKIPARRISLLNN